MSKISENITQIRTAVYGREVREAIASAFESWDEHDISEMEEMSANASNAVTVANAASSSAASALEKAEAASTTATEAAETVNETVETVQAAVTDAQNALESVNSKVDGGEVVNGELFLIANGEQVAGPFKLSQSLLDQDGNEYELALVNGEIVAKKIEKMFPGKNVAGVFDFEDIYTDDSGVFHIIEKQSGEDIRGYNNSKNYVGPFRNFTGSGTTFTSPEWINSIVNGNEFSVVYWRRESDAGSWASIIESSQMMNISGGGKIEISNRFNGLAGWSTWDVEITKIPYITKSGEEKYLVNDPVYLDSRTYPVKEYKCLTAVSFKQNGEIDTFAKGYKLHTYSAPEDFDHWNMRILLGQDQWAGSNLCTGAIGPDNQFVFLGNAITEKDLDEYNSFLSQSAGMLKSVSSVALESGDAFQIPFIIDPEKHKDSVMFSSSNPEVAEVSRDGIVIAKAVGTAEISASFQDLKVTVDVKVGGDMLSDESKSAISNLSTRSINKIVLVNEDDIPDLYPGDEFSLYALGLNTTLAMPYKVQDQNMLKFLSSDPSVCSANFGVLHALKPGTATITISSMDGTTTLTKSITVKSAGSTFVASRDTYISDDRKHDIYNDGTHSTETTNGLKDALAYASENGYRKIVFAPGTYLIDASQCPIDLPSDLEVDFSGATVKPNPAKTVLPGSAYVMFRMQEAENASIKNAVIYGDNINGDFRKEGCISLSVIGGKNIRIENCEFSYSPGFNLALSYTRKSLAGLRLADIEEGGFTDSGADDNSQTGYRGKNFIALSEGQKEFGFGNMQGFQGYLYLSTRLYDIYFYDENDAFIESRKYCVQYQTYPLPAGAKKVKIHFWQDFKPTNSDPDFGSVAHVYSLANPQNVVIKDCVFRYNYSTAISPQGGKNVLIENCIFESNGKYDPSSSIDWEDGRIHIQGHILRKNTFSTSAGYTAQLNLINGRDVVFHDNFIDVPLQIQSESQNTRCYRNRIKTTSVTTDSKSDAIYAKNILAAALPTPAAPVGGTIMQYENDVLA